jgi:hypothetical protein
MAAKVNSIICSFLALVSINCHSGTITRKHYTPTQYLKNYALSSCIADGHHQSKEVSSDAVASANGYKELGSLDIEAYNEAAILARTFLSKNYMSYSGENLVIMKCIDFFYSKELDRLARKYAPQK